MNSFRNYLLVTIIFIAIAFTLTTAKVSNVIAEACAPAPFGMVSWWPGDGNANDIQGNNHGTLQNGAAFAPGMVSQTFGFDGVNDYVDVGDVDLPATFSIDAWIRPNDVTTTQYIVSKDDGDTARSYFFAVEHSGTLVGSVRNTTGGFTQYRTSVPVVIGGTWQHVAMTYNGGAPIAGKMAFYVNGTSYPISVIGPFDSGGTPEDNALTLKIGIFGDAVGSPFNGPFNGLIDELEIFARVLTAAEIQAIYNAGSAGKCKDEDGDGVPDPADQCPNSNISPTVVIGECDSGVPNTLFPNGCTISDRIEQCTVGAQNHGQFVSCVAHLTNELKRAGVITGQQKGAIQSCAAQANIP